MLTTKKFQVLMTVISCVFAFCQTADAYSIKDAQWVIDTKDKAALSYVVCLQSAMSKAPKSQDHKVALKNAKPHCSVAAEKIPKSGKVQIIDNIHNNIMECGFKLGDDWSDSEC